MIVTVQKVLDVARGELGYHEKASNAQLDDKTANSGTGNYTKYARDLYNAGYYNDNKNGYAWCDVGVDWCFYIAAEKNAELAQKIECQTGPLGAGCLYSAQYYKAQGRWGSDPDIGAQIFFTYAPGEVSHTGLVESFTSASVTVIEFNTSDMVARRTYMRNDSRIYGYGYPLYDKEITASAPATPSTSAQTPTETPKTSTSSSPATKYSGHVCRPTLPLLELGCLGPCVVSLQQLLIAKGCSVGPDGADGDFGRATHNAVRTYQARKNLEIDGQVGSETWKSLLGVN